MTDFKPGRYKTRDGRDAVVLCDDALGKWPLKGFWIDSAISASYASEWSLEGTSVNGSKYDLIPPAPPVRVEWWVVRFVAGFDSKDISARADEAAARFLVSRDPSYALHRVELIGNEVQKIEVVK